MRQRDLLMENWEKSIRYWATMNKRSRAWNTSLRLPGTLLELKDSFSRIGHEFRQTKRDDYFRVIFTTLKQMPFWGSWGWSRNFLKPRTKPLKENLAKISLSKSGTLCSLQRPNYKPWQDWRNLLSLLFVLEDMS